MRRIARWGWLLAPLLVAPAKVYRCEAGGQVTYTDRACEAGAAPADLPTISVLPGTKGPDLAKQYDARAKREREAHEKAEAAWSEAYAKEKEARSKAEAARQAQRAARRKAAREGYTVKSPPPADAPKK